MHYYTKKLFEEINSILENSPLIFFSKDPERGLGLEQHLKNYFIASIEDSYITDQLGERTFALSKYDKSMKSLSTLELVTNTKTTNWIESHVKDKEFYSQLFQFSQPAMIKLEKMGSKVLNNSASLNRKFEDKLSQVEFFTKKGLKFPKYSVITLNNQSFEEVLGLVHSNNQMFVAQTNRSHTGSGTFFINNSTDWVNFVSEFKGNEIKISEYIDGESYTINGCVTKKGVFVAGLQYQITGIPTLTHGKGSTVGNDFSFANNLDQSLKSEILLMTKQIGEGMAESGYRGLFGIDLMISNNGEVFLIEVNARQTANISFQTKLEISQDRIPLSLINLAEWMNIEIEFEPFSEISSLEGSQIFLRSRVDNFLISEQLKSGVYRLQSDNAAFLVPDSQVINIDEEKDKPLIWQRDGYSIEGLNQDGFILLVQKINSVRNSFDEIARMQFDKGIILIQNDEVIVSPWVIEAMQEIFQRVI